MSHGPSLADCRNFVVCSDLHLGEERSRLMDPTQRQALANVLGEIQETHGATPFDALVLAGDVVDLSMATYREAFDAFAHLLDAVGGYFNRIVFVPGNHDHHIWLMSNEGHEIFRQFQPSRPTVPAGFCPRTVRCYLANEHVLSAFEKGDLAVRVAYPNAVFLPPHSQSRAFIVHHGHLIEDLYRILSDLYKEVFSLPVVGLEDLECVNSGWIEFIWYSFGQSGRHGANGFVENLYDKVQKGQTEPLKGHVKKLYDYRLKKIVDKTVPAAAEKEFSWVRPKKLRDWIVNKTASWVNEKAPDWIWSGIESYMKREKDRDRIGSANIRGNVLDDGLARACGNYITNELRPAYADDLSNRDLIFIFGHTHKRGVYPEQDPVFYNCGSFLIGSPAYLFFVDDHGQIHTYSF